MFERWELHVGDLCVFVGDEKHCQLKRRTVYQVMHKELADQSSFSYHRYRYRVAFDIENPSGTSVETFERYGTKDIKRLSLIDMGIIRLSLDNFIKEWARECGDDSEK